jgi:hypothetical protein
MPVVVCRPLGSGKLNCHLLWPTPKSRFGEKTWNRFSIEELENVSAQKNVDANSFVSFKSIAFGPIETK